MELLQTLLEYVIWVDTQTMDLVVAVRIPILTKLMNSVTGLGSASAALVFFGLSYRAGWRREVRVSVLALVVSGLVVGTLMLTVQRAYPGQPVCLTGGAETIAHSFPSGHAAIVAVYATVARYSDQFQFAFVSPVALLIAVSRIYLGTHYLSDTVIGVLIGVGSVLFARRLLESRRVDGLTGDAEQWLVGKSE